MSRLADWLGGLSRPRSRRQERVTVGSVAIARPARQRPGLHHPHVQLAVGAGFSLASAVVLLQGRPPTLRGVLGVVVLTALLNGLFFAYLFRFRRDALRSRARSVLAAAMGLLVLVVARLSTLPDWPPALVPVTAATIVFAVVFDRRYALEASFLLIAHVAAILASAPGADAAGLVRALLVLASGVLAAVLATGRIRTRGKIIRIGVFVGIVHLVAIAGFHLAFAPTLDSETFLLDLAWGLGHGVLVGFVISGSLPLLEFLFGISTDISLLELSNISQQPVLRRLLVAAPGTYNHSFVVGMLAEEAAEAIGANPLLARVGAYYHDIGKMMKPEYFGENEMIPGEHHRPLTPTMSTLIIKSHVKDGAELARHHDLPRPIVEIIEQHHGTTLVEYFHNEAKTRAKEGERVEESVFRYDGRKPQTREAGVVMLADSVEAATRSLTNPTPASMESTIRGVSRGKLDDGQLDECGLTLLEVRTIDDSFIRVLAGLYHRRPRYPAGVKRGGGVPPAGVKGREGVPPAGVKRGEEVRAAGYTSS
ncbi:MAG: HDIG domain-containing metalloprotein [Planctomycetota bacterium]